MHRCLEQWERSVSWRSPYRESKMKSQPSLLERLFGKRSTQPDPASKRLQDIKSGKRAWVSLGETNGIKIKVLRVEDD